MNRKEISRLLESKSPFLLLETFDRYPEKRPRYEIITLERLVSFSSANVAGSACISHLEKYGPDEVSLVDFEWFSNNLQLVLARDNKDGRIYDFNSCGRKYREFATKFIRNREMKNKQNQTNTTLAK